MTLSGTGKVPPPVTPGQPKDIVLVSGDQQSGVTGSALAAPLVVRVLDDNGTPVPGTMVIWQVRAGNGTLSAATTTPDANGQTSITYAPSAGTNQVKALMNASSSTTFTSSSPASRPKADAAARRRPQYRK